MHKIRNKNISNSPWKKKEIKRTINEYFSKLLSKYFENMNEIKDCLENWKLCKFQKKNIYIINQKVSRRDFEKVIKQPNTIKEEDWEIRLGNFLPSLQVRHFYYYIQERNHLFFLKKKKKSLKTIIQKKKEKNILSYKYWYTHHKENIIKMNSGLCFRNSKMVQ